MDNVENQTPSSQPQPADLRAQVDSLAQMVSSLLVLTIILSGTLNIFFWHQYQAKRAEVNILNQFINEFNNTQQIRKEFVARLLDFEKKNPDFSPIVQKYNLRDALPALAPSSPASAPAKPPANK
jgi:hypothetical protein